MCSSTNTEDYAISVSNPHVYVARLFSPPRDPKLERTLLTKWSHSAHPEDLSGKSYFCFSNSYEMNLQRKHGTPPSNFSSLFPLPSSQLQIR